MVRRIGKGNRRRLKLVQHMPHPRNLNRKVPVPITNLYGHCPTCSKRVPRGSICIE